MSKQLSFDLDALMRQETVETPWHGAPLAYTTDYYPPEELAAAFARYKAEHGSFGSVPNSHMWNQAITFTRAIVAGGHALHMLTADARCEQATHAHPTPLPDDLVYQAICPPCSWHYIEVNENSVVEAWHDHALTGWRNLPVVPAKCAEDAGRKDLQQWVERHYPTRWQQPGYPIITQRGARRGRHVPYHSPFGGYELAHHQCLQQR